MPLITLLTITTAVCAPLSLIIICIGISVQYNCSREHTRHIKELIKLKKHKLSNSELNNEIEGYTTDL